MGSILFGKFKIPASHIFVKTELSFGFVNLRPIVPGHVLISPRRVVGRLKDLTEEEYTDLWSTVRTTQNMLVKRYGPSASAFNVAVQDGAASGQSVPHVHVHILPRSQGDYQTNDHVHNELQEWAPRKEMTASQAGKATLDVPEDGDRNDRTPHQMAEEAAAYGDLL